MIALATFIPRKLPGKGEKVKVALIVDDEPLIRRQILKTLTDYGFNQIYEAENGSEAINLARRYRPLLTVMDITMPLLDGISAAVEINRDPSGPIVLLTGTTDSETVTKAREAGVHHYLMKPFKEEQLKISLDLAIHQFIEMSNLHDEIAKLKETLETRKLVDRAKAALIKSGMSEPDAHRRIQKLAMDKRKNLKEVAEAILIMEN